MQNHNMCKVFPRIVYRITDYTWNCEGGFCEPYKCITSFQELCTESQIIRGNVKAAFAGLISV